MREGPQCVRVADGRRLAWAEYGDPAGHPVLYHHGGLNSHLDAATAHEPARALGVRLVAPDRPGIGASDRLPGRRLVDWPADVVDDYRVMSAPWGFDLGAVRAPTVLWQGTADTLVPAAWARRRAERIPGATVVLLEGDGHVLPAARYEEMLARLTGAA